MLQSDKRYYFDANVLFKYYKDEQGSLEIRRLVTNAHHLILVSELTLLECFSVAMKYRRKGIFKTRKITLFSNALKKVANARSRQFELVPIPQGTFKLAHEILLNYAKNNDFGSHDALHLAIVKKQINQAIMVTSDEAMKNVCAQVNIPIYDPELKTE